MLDAKPRRRAGAFGNEIDYAMLVKLYGENPAPGPEPQVQPGPNALARSTPERNDRILTLLGLL